MEMTTTELIELALQGLEMTIRQGKEIRNEVIEHINYLEFELNGTAEERENNKHLQFAKKHMEFLDNELKTLIEKEQYLINQLREKNITVKFKKTL